MSVDNTDRVHEQVRTIKIEIVSRHNDMRARSPIISSGRQKKPCSPSIHTFVCAYTLYTCPVDASYTYTYNYRLIAYAHVAALEDIVNGTWCQTCIKLDMAGVTRELSVHVTILITDLLSEIISLPLYSITENNTHAMGTGSPAWAIVWRPG